MDAIFFNTPIEDNFIGHQMAEIYRDNIYAPFFRGGRLATIIDVGANIGLTSYYFSQRAGKVYAIEPSLEHFTVLTKMLTHNKIENVVPIRKAIYIKEGELPLFHNENKTMYSLHTAVASPKDKPEKVECITLDKLFDEEKIEHCDFMKLDVEGSEVEIISSAGFRKVAPKINSLLLETHAWNQRHPNQIKDALKQLGFNLSYPKSSAEIIIATK